MTATGEIVAERLRYLTLWLDRKPAVRAWHAWATFFAGVIILIFPVSK
jgi:hypothetical protein